MIIKKVSLEKITGIYKSAEDAELSKDWKKIKKESEEKTNQSINEDINGSN